MMIKVRFLANYRELAGRSESLLDLREGGTVGSLLDELYRQFPKLSEHKDEVLVSVNKRQAPDGLILREGDELVLLPPAVGG